jgi:hypothetical protein
LTLDLAAPPLAGTVSAGATRAAYSWYFADAPTAEVNQYLLISNPSRGQARVTVEVLLADDTRESDTLVMPAGSRFTFPVSERYPDQSEVSATVRSTQPIVVERSLFPDAGIGAGGGSTALGVPGD